MTILDLQNILKAHFPQGYIDIDDFGTIVLSTGMTFESEDVCDFDPNDGTQKLVPHEPSF